MKKINGYSLVELALSIVAIAVIYSFVAGNLSSIFENNIGKKNQEKIQYIQYALENFTAAYGRLPCPAPLSVSELSSSFGNESDCSMSVFPSGIDSITSGADTLIVGGLPVRTLGINDNYAYDGWNIKFNYIVIKSLATTALNFLNYTPGNSIQLKNTGLTSINTENDIAYLIISHGANQNGGYTTSGVIKSPCANGKLDAYNCGTTGNFIIIDKNHASAWANRYDDIIVWSTRKHLIKNTNMAVSLIN